MVCYYYFNNNEATNENKMTLINKVANKFNATPISSDSIKFPFGEDDYCLTDGTLYSVVDGKFCSSKKVKTMLSLENFIADRC